MVELSIEKILKTTAEDAWKIISCFNNVIKYVPAVVRSTREGKGAGSVRTLVLADGARVVEKLERIEESKSPSLTYSIVNLSLSIANYFATMKVQEIDSSRCKLVWSSTFTVRGISDAEAGEFVREMYIKGFKRLEKLYDGLI